MISEIKNNESVDIGGEQVRTTFRNVAAPEQFDFDEQQWADQPLPVILTAYREAYGQTIYQVAESLRIRAVYIQYLENGQYDELPGDTYAIGFIRTYTTYLGLPVDKMVALYKKETGAESSTTTKSIRQPSEASMPMTAGLPKVAMMVSGLALVAILFVGWFYLSSDDDPRTVPVASISEDLLNKFNATDPDLANSATNGTAPSVAENGGTSGDLFDDGPIVIDETGEQSSLNTPADVNVVEAVAVLPKETVLDGQTAAVLEEGDISSGRQSAPAGLAPVPEPKPGREVVSAAAVAVTPLPTREELAGALPGSRVVIQATELSWLQVRKAGDEVLISKVLQPGETQEVPNQEGLRLLTGSIGGLSILVDGQSVVPSGPNNGYSVDISLNPEELLASAN